MNKADIVMLVIGVAFAIALFFGIRYHVKNRKEDCSAITPISVVFFLLFPALPFALTSGYFLSKFVDIKFDITMWIVGTFAALTVLTLVLMPIIGILRCDTVVEAKLISWEHNGGGRNGPARRRLVFEYEFEGKKYECASNAPLLNGELPGFELKARYDIYISKKLPTLCRPWRRIMQYEIYGMICGAALVLVCLPMFLGK